jgi:trimeric autotransporter adhesin
MMKKFYVIFSIFIPLTCLKAQLKTGNNPGVLHASAVFEAESSTKGILIPRMTTAEMNAIASPTLGLMVFNTDLNCLQFYFSGWKSQCDPANVGAWSLLGNGGTNPSTNFIGTTDAQALAFRTNNAEQMRINSSGNVGIGTNNPGYRLDVAGGDFQFANTSGGYFRSWGETDIEYDGGADGLMTFRNNSIGGRTRFFGENGEIMRINNNGNVGIGIVPPQYRLDIDARNGGGNPLRLQGLNAGTTTDSILTSAAGVVRRMGFNQFINNTAWSLTGNSGTNAGTNFLGTTDAQDLVFKTNSVEGMRLATNGRLGINTNLPSSAITVVNKNGTDQADDIQIRTFTNGTETPAFIYRKAKGTEALPLTLGNSEYIGGIDGYAYDGSVYQLAGGIQSFTSSTFTTDRGTELQFGTSKNGVFTRNTVLNANGNFGINTLSPQYKLDVNAQSGGTGNPLRLLGLNAGAVTDSILTSNLGVIRRLNFADLLSNANAVTGTGVATRVAFWNSPNTLSSNTNLYWDNTNNRLGIGTNSPIAPLNIVNDGGGSGVNDDVIVQSYGTSVNPAFVGLSARGTSTSPQNLQYDDTMGNISFYGRSNGGSGNTFSTIQSKYKGNGTTNLSNLEFVTSSSLKAVLDENGNFGIGLGIPLYKLDVDSRVGAAGNPLRLLGLNAGASTDSVLTSAAGVIRRQSVAEITANAWNILGNSNTTDGTHFLGTTNSIPLNFRVNNEKSGRIDHLLFNTSLGYQSANANTIGTENTSIGYQALQNNTTGGYSIAIGYQALQTQSFSNSGATWVAHNVAIGNRALWKNQPTSTTNGIYNTAIGNHTLYNNTTGTYNTAIGNSVLFNNTTANLNTAIGYEALKANTTGYQNVAVGSLSLVANVDGYANTAHGHQTLFSNTSGYENSAFGNAALLQNTTGFRNTANGTFSMRNNTIGSYNTSIGNSSLYNNTTSNRNIAIGYEALTTQSFTNAGVSYNTDNIGIGYQALRLNQPTASFNGSQNVAIGTSALASNTIGYQNIAVGTLSMANNTDGFANSALGQQALQNNTTGNQNSAFGNSTLINNTTGQNNSSVGANAMRFNTIGSYNSTLGTYSLYNNTTASRNVAIGYDALNTQSFSNGGVAWNSDNIAIGYRALFSNQPTANNNGFQNVAIGADALSTNTTGSNNTAISPAALQTNLTGNQNVAIGQAAMVFNSTGSFNTAVGQSSLFNNVSGSSNTALGTSSLYNNTASNNVAIGISMFSNTTGGNNTATGYQTMNNFQTGSNNVANGYRALAGSGTPASNTGSNNTAIGYQALHVSTSGSSNTALGYLAGQAITSGSNNTLIGTSSEVSTGTLTNATAIGNGAVVDASNKIRLGNTSVTLVETYGNFVTVSDRRLKKNIGDNNIGLNFIKDIRPVHYELKDTAHAGIIYDGFIAQEIETILTKNNIKFSGLVKPNTEGGHYTVNYATFVVPLVNAVKELDKKNDERAIENATLKAELEKLKTENAALKNTVDKNDKDIQLIKAQLGIKN